MAASYFVVLDSNVWITEQLLKSSVGIAALYAVAGSGAQIGLPEVVETEVSFHLIRKSDEAVDEIRDQMRLIKYTSGRDINFTAPTTEAIKEGIQRRWTELEGVLRRVPFTFDQAKAALSRVHQHLPPSGANNEQFRDCCVWEAALALSLEGPVHLVTNDNSFFEPKDRTKLARHLLDEAKERGHGVQLYANMKEFMAAIADSVKALDENAIKTAIVTAVAPEAQRLGSDHAEKAVLGAVRYVNIHGYATPTASVVAITYEVSFDSTFRLKEAEAKATITVRGSCSYDPTTNKISDVEITSGSISHDGPYNSTSIWDKDRFARHSARQTRIISA